MDGQWRQEIPEDMRKQMITEMYHELARISGEVDKQKVWGSAAKFELMLWSNSPDKNTYLVKMQRKIMSLKKKMGAGDNTAQQQQPQAIAQPNMIATNPGAINTAAMNAAAMNAATSMNAAAATSNPMVVNAANMAAAAGLNPQQFQANVNANQAVNMMNNFQQANNVMGAANGTTPVTAAAVNPSVTVGMSASNAVGNTVNTPAATTAVNIAAPPHQQAQQWLQRIQVQFQAQQQQLLHTQNQEIQQLRQQHLNQQQQLAQQQQQGGVSPDLRRQQLQNLQQQHQLARTRLQQLHKGKQQQLQRKQQQYLLQKQQQLQQQQQQQQAQLNNAATTVTSTMMGNTQVGTSSAAMNLPNATTIQTPAPSVVSAANATSQAQAAMAARNVKPEQLSAAHNQQAAMRELQRQQNTAELEQNGLKHGNNGMPTTPTGGAAAAAADDGNSGPYVERLKELRRKYWDDLVIVFREFERMVKQKPASQQQERINTFLINLKRIIALLQQDPTKATNTRNDLDRVEAHIQKQVLPILERLKNKTRAAAGVNAATAAQQQQQQEQLKKQQLEQQRLAQLQEQQKKLQEQQKAEQQRKLMEEQKKKQLEAATAAAKKQQEMLEQQRKQQQQRAQQQAFLQQQRQKVLAQQQQQLAAAQLNKVQQNQLRANAAAGAVVATAQQPTVAGGADANNLAAQTSGVNSATAVTPPVVGVTPAVSSATVASPNSANGNAALTPAQYRTFKLPDAQKQRLTAQHAKLREQQQELIMQQSRAKTPAQQAKLAQQAQRLAHMINKISQQLVQCKLAEEYEQTQGKPLSMGTPTSVSQPTMSQASVATMALNKSKPMKVEDLPGGAVTTPTSVNVIANGIASAVAGSALAAANALAANGAMAVPAAVADAPLAVAGLADVSKPADISAATDPAFKSVVPDLTGLGASEKLLTAVAAYEKHKPEVLKRGSSRFSRIAVTIGAKLNTSYVAT